MASTVKIKLPTLVTSTLVGENLYTLEEKSHIST